MTATVRFTEEMLGHVTFGEADFDRGAEPARDLAVLRAIGTRLTPDILPMGAAAGLGSPTSLDVIGTQRGGR